MKCSYLTYRQDPSIRYMYAEAMCHIPNCRAQITCVCTYQSAMRRPIFKGERKSMTMNTSERHIDEHLHSIEQPALKVSC